MADLLPPERPTDDQYGTYEAERECDRCGFTTVLRAVYWRHRFEECPGPIAFRRERRDA
jgi:hypothetical protein